MFLHYDDEIYNCLQYSNDYHFILKKCVSYICDTKKIIKELTIFNYICMAFLLYIINGNHIVYERLIVSILISIHICSLVLYYGYIKCMIKLYKYKVEIYSKIR